MDKWLWAVRLYKTRTLAVEACQAGHVKVAGQNVKAARLVRIGELITARTGDVTRTVRVIGLIGQRVGAKLVSNYLEDLTPASESEKGRESYLMPTFVRGAGRPTKKDRRAFEKIRREGA